MNNFLREFSLEDPDSPLYSPVIAVASYAITALTTPHDLVYTESLPGGGVAQIIRDKSSEVPQTLFFSTTQGVMRKMTPPLAFIHLSNSPTYGRSVQGVKWWAVGALDDQKTSPSQKSYHHNNFFTDRQVYFINLASLRGYGPFPPLGATIISPIAPSVLQFQYRTIPREGDAYLLIVSPSTGKSQRRRGTYSFAFSIPPEEPAQQLDGDEFSRVQGSTLLLANSGLETFIVQYFGNRANVIRALTGEVIAAEVPVNNSAKITKVFLFPSDFHAGWAVYRPELLSTSPQANAEVAAVMANLPRGPMPPWTTVLEVSPNNLVVYHNKVNMFPGEEIISEDPLSILEEALYNQRKTWITPEQISLKVRVRIPGVKATKKMALSLKGTPMLLPWKGGGDA